MTLWLAYDNFHITKFLSLYIYDIFIIFYLAVMEQEMMEYLSVCLVSFLSVKVRFLSEISLYFAEQHKSLIADVCLTH